MIINTVFLEKCVQTLEKALQMLNKSESGSIDYEMYQSACIKEFEIILEQSGKLLKKTLKPYFHASKEVDKLFFKDIFRQAALHGIISIDEVDRWIAYRDNRNLTVHDYGAGFAEDTLKLFPDFIKDARQVITAIEKQNNAHS
jgi:nucleotidyltransferase substrate binding protein (TIGR01987 family)